MKELSKVEETRLSNLKLLHGSVAEFGAPTSGGLAAFFSSNKVNITSQRLSNIYHRKETIDMFLAASIERAFGVPEGWLSEDQSFLRAVNPEDLPILQAYIQLPEPLKLNIAEIIKALSEANA
ncbi:hypothetical protein D3C85_1489110 [compost metagenome]